MQGRKPDTDEVRRAKGKGTAKGADKSEDIKAALDNEADVNNQPGAPPSWLTDNLALKIWEANNERNRSLNYIKDTDSFAVARYAQYCADWIRSSLHLKREGTTYKVTSAHGSYVRAHPLVKIRRDTERDLRDMEDRLGLSPLSRMRILNQLSSGGGMVLPPLNPQPAAPGDGPGEQPAEVGNVFDYFATSTPQ